MTITFSQTARDVVLGAMEDRGIADPDDVTGAEMAYGIRKLNEILKALQAEGFSPWTDLEATATFAADTAEVTLSPRPVEVSEARVAYTTGYTRVLHRLSHGEYDRYPNRAQSGIPVAYEIRKTPTDVAMRVWPVPTVETDIEYSYNRVIEDVSEATALDMPQMWAKAINLLLQAEMTKFGPVPPDVVYRAEMAKQIMADFDRPESYTINAFN